MKTDSKGSIGSKLKGVMENYSMYIFLVVIAVVFQFMTDGTLMLPLNITNIILQNSYILILAIGMMILIILGHIDLSVGSVMAFVGAIASKMMITAGMNTWLTVVVCLIIGALIGAFQGFWVAYVKVPAFIATLAGMLLFRGLTIVVTGGKSIGPFPQNFQLISSGFIPDLFSGSSLHIFTLVVAVLIVAFMNLMAIRKRIMRKKNGVELEPLAWFVIKTVVVDVVLIVFSYLLAQYEGFPNILIILAVLIFIYNYLTTRTVVGRRIYAIGGNEKAAKLSGINTRFTTFTMFVNMGVLAAVSGLVFAARLNAATANAGQGFELDAIAACYIGGASAYGGVGSITGAIIGGLVMGLLNNGMSLLGVGVDWQQAIKGGVLLLVVAFDIYNKSKTSEQ